MAAAISFNGAPPCAVTTARVITSPTSCRARGAAGSTGATVFAGAENTTSVCVCVGAWFMIVSPSGPEHDTRRHRAGEHVRYGVIDLVELAFDGDDPGTPRGVQREDVGEVVAGPDDGT